MSRISTTGASEYKLNGKVVTYTNYNAALISHNILVKAKNFLVFQGDVEAVASQSPRELTRLIEQISGSLELAAEYDKAKAGQEKATDSATSNFTKRRGIAGEIKQYKEQKTEAERYERKCGDRVRSPTYHLALSSNIVLRISSLSSEHCTSYIISKRTSRITSEKSMRAARRLKDFGNNRIYMVKSWMPLAQTKPGPGQVLCRWRER